MMYKGDQLRREKRRHFVGAIKTLGRLFAWLVFIVFLFVSIHFFTDWFLISRLFR